MVRVLATHKLRIVWEDHTVYATLWHEQHAADAAQEQEHVHA
jgi:hypothetical protein